MPSDEAQFSTENLEKGQRVFRGRQAFIVTVLLAAFAFYFLWTAGFGYRSSEVYRGLYLMGTMVAAFLLYPATSRSPRSSASVADILLAVASVLTVGYWIVEYNTYWTTRPAMPNTLDLYAGGLLILLSLEMARRVLGWPLALLALAFLGQLYFGRYLPGILRHRGFGVSRIIEFNFMTQEAIFGQILGIFASYVFPFIIFGAFLQKTGGGEFFIDLARALTGRRPGGPALMAVVSSALFGSISGSPVANVVATGSFTIPLMKRVGYEPHRAGAVEAAASTGGQFLPPVMGAGAFILATLTETPYSRVMIMAAVPALMYFFYVGLSVYFYARNQDMSGLPPDEIPDWRLILRRGWYFVAVPAILVVLIGSGYSPQLAAFWATVVLLAATLIRPDGRRRFGAIFVDSLVTATRDSLIVGGTVGALGIIIGGITLSGLGLRFSSAVLSLAGDNLFLALWLVTAIALVIGMGMPTTASYVVMAILAAPALIRLGLPPIAAHFIVFWLAMTSNVTPPVCVAAFAGAAIANANPMRTGLTAMKMCLVLYAMPFAFAYRPAIMLLGSGAEIAHVVVAYTLGLICVAGAAEGWLLGNLRLFQRIGLLAAGTLLFSPPLYASLLGTLVAGAVLLSLTRPMAQRARATP